MRILTLDQLIQQNACARQAKLFWERFENSVIVTEKLAASLADKFDFDWAGANLLSHTASSKYIKASHAALDKHNAMSDDAQEEYAEFPNDHSTCLNALEAADALYLKTIAIAFARLYITDTTDKLIKENPCDLICTQK